MNSQRARETKNVRVSVLGTIVWIPLIVAFFLTGRSDVAMVASVAFMVGYLVERIRLHRKIIHLIDASSPP